jgi:hypothetical protein
MNENILSGDVWKANPTLRVCERVLRVIRDSQKPIALTRVSKISKAGFYETKTAVDFFIKLGVLRKVLASGDFCFLEFIFPKLNSAPVAS